jgi:valyl-tRNA synthetase
MIDKEVLEAGENAKTAIAAIRELRTRIGLKSKDLACPMIQTGNARRYKPVEQVISKMSGSAPLQYINESLSDSLGSTIGADIVYLSLPDDSDAGQTVLEQRKKLEEELKHLKGFLDLSNKKLGNERFIQNAKPEVVQLEQKKKTDTESKIRVLEESLAALGS